MSTAGQQNRANLEGTFAGAFNAFLLRALSNTFKFSIVLAIAFPLWAYFVEGQLAFDLLEIFGSALGFAVLFAFFEILLPRLQNSDPVAEGTKAVLKNRDVPAGTEEEGKN